MKNISKSLKQERIKQGLSQIEMAEKMGVSNTQISRIENDPMCMTVKTLKKALDVLGISIETTPDIISKIEQRIETVDFRIKKDKSGKIFICEGANVYGVSEWLSKIFSK